jgi:hypothetical protein
MGYMLFFLLKVALGDVSRATGGSPHAPPRRLRLQAKLF